MTRLAWWGWLLVPGTAAAQDQARAPAFTGIHAGPEIGVQEHGFGLTTSGPLGVGEREDQYSRTGIAGGGFAGVDFPLSSRLRLGVEAGATIGGGPGGRADLFDNNRFEQRPRWGYRAVGRAGYVIGDRTLAFATLGYGAQRYRLRTSIFIDGVREWQRGVAVGVGVERRISPAAALRIDARHIAGTSNQLSIGLPIRF